MWIAARAPRRATGYDWAYSWDAAGVAVDVRDDVASHLLRDNNTFNGFYECPPISYRPVQPTVFSPDVPDIAAALAVATTP